MSENVLKSLLFAGFAFFCLFSAEYGWAADNFPVSQNKNSEKLMTPKDYLSSHSIKVRHENGVWILASPSREVRLTDADLKMTVKTPKCEWSFLPADENDLILRINGQKINTGFLSACSRTIEPYDTGVMTGVMIKLSKFKTPKGVAKITLRIMLGLEVPGEDLVCQIVPEEKENSSVEECRWPKACDPTSVDVAVIPAMQGMLLPRDWPQEVRLYGEMTYSRALYMPWWGFEKGPSAMMMILETPDDAWLTFSHPAGGPTKLEVRWMSSLGKMQYFRRARFSFYDEGNYVTLAKRYRQYVVDHGNFVSLKEKIARDPLVKKLIGSPVIHTTILYHAQPESSFYDKNDPAKNDQLFTFKERTDQLKKLSVRGVTNAYVHLDGWGYRGYDNLHPDIVPPCPQAGGWDGFRYLADTCNQLGYPLAIHDQYRDYYYDAASFNERHGYLYEDGTREFCQVWLGGKQTLLCASLAPGYVMRNIRALLGNGVKIKGAYLDVFSIMPLMECCNPEHPMTRMMCKLYQAECFNYVRSRLGIVSSEEPADWSIPYLDLVHHGPYSILPNLDKGVGAGIPVPLFNLVYHDAIFLPWSWCGNVAGRGGWGLPETDSGYLHLLLNAGLPYLSIEPTDEELKLMRQACDLNKKLALKEMVNHEFLDKSYRKQRTTYSDGTTITVNFDTCEYEISK